MMHKNGTGPRIRVVATGEAGNGDSEVVSDKEVAPVETKLLPGALFYSLWGADLMPALPNDGDEPKFSTWFPPDGGFRYELIILPPDDTQPPANLDKAAALAQTAKVLPGLMQAMDPKHPGMHQTDTIDLIYVTEGACVLVLDGGGEVTLRAGDVLVQNGPRRAWRNPNAEPCGLLTVSIGVKRKS